MRVMFHDDDCDDLLDQDGQCPTCKFHPDMQSTGFKDISVGNAFTMLRNGRTLLGLYREPITLSALRVTTRVTPMGKVIVTGGEND